VADNFLRNMFTLIMTPIKVMGTLLKHIFFPDTRTIMLKHMYSFKGKCVDNQVNVSFSFIYIYIYFFPE
jgi:hypothetical protein